MQALDQTDEEQVDIQIGQDLIHLVSHQLLNSAASLQIIYDLWNEPDALSTPHQAETLQVLQHEVNFLHRLGRYILQLDRTSSGELLLTLKPVDIIDLLLVSYTLYLDASPTLSQRHLDITIMIP